MTEPESVGLTLRQLVLEIRTDVKSLDAKIDQIDRTGSIGTREELRDHESRLRSIERWRYAIPPAFLLGAAAIIAPLFLHGA